MPLGAAPVEERFMEFKTSLNSKFIWSALLVVSPLFLTGCLQADSSSSATPNIAATTTTGTILIQPATMTVAPGAVIDFSASGGTGTYTYYTFSTLGALNSSTGVYTAPSTAGTYTVEAIDSNNNYGISTITVSTSATSTSTSLAFSTPSESVIPGGVLDLSVSGGSGNYTFALTGGGGAITSTGATYVVYTAPSAEGTATLSVTDTSTNAVAYATVTISSSSSTTTTYAEPVQVYVLYNENAHDWMYSLSSASVGGYDPALDAFVVMSQAVTGSVAVYQCLTTNGHHLLTTNPNCEGWTMQSTLGYIMTAASASEPIALYRFNYQGRAQATWTTVNYNQAATSNDPLQLVLGYVSAQ